MKKIVLPLLTIILFSFTSEEYGITDEEREKAIVHLTKSRDHMMEVLNGLTEEQLVFQVTEDSWSVADCAEHIAISEKNSSEMLKNTVAEGNNPALKETIKFSDDQLVKTIIDRSNKVKTSQAFEPNGSYEEHKAIMESFAEKRAEHIDYVKTTKDDLRNRFNSDLPFGTIDAYQLLLFTSGHTERHVLQMEEIMSNKYFPGKQVQD